MIEEVQWRGFWTRVQLPSSPLHVMCSRSKHIAYADACGRCSPLNASVPIIFNKNTPRNEVYFLFENYNYFIPITTNFCGASFELELAILSPTVLKETFLEPHAVKHINPKQHSNNKFFLHTYPPSLICKKYNPLLPSCFIHNFNTHM